MDAQPALPFIPQRLPSPKFSWPQGTWHQQQPLHEHRPDVKFYTQVAKPTEPARVNQTAIEDIERRLYDVKGHVLKKCVEFVWLVD